MQFSERQQHISDRGNYECQFFDLGPKFHRKRDLQPQIVFLKNNFITRTFSNRLKFQGAIIPYPIRLYHWRNLTQKKSCRRAGVDPAGRNPLRLYLQAVDLSKQLIVCTIKILVHDDEIKQVAVIIFHLSRFIDYHLQLFVLRTKHASQQ